MALTLSFYLQTIWGRRVTSLDFASLAIFLLVLWVAGFTFFRNLYPLFGLISITDVLATLLSSRQVVLIDRSLFAISAIVDSSINPILSDGAYLMLEVTLLFLVLDFSFFLRKLSDSKFGISIVKQWMGTAGSYLAVSFIVSFGLIYLYSYSGFLSSGAPILAASSVSAIIMIFVAFRLFLVKQMRKR